MKTIAEFAKELAWLKMQAINNALLDQIIKIEGRPPSLQEASRLGGIFIFPDGREEYRWRGMTVLKVTPPFDGRNWTITKV